MGIEVGQIIGATTLRGFRFVIKKGMERYVKRDEFVTVKESVTNNKVLGVIKDITISNELLPDEFGRDLRLGDIFLTEGEYPVPTVKILGYEKGNALEIPRYGIKPGSIVYLAEDELLKRILQQNPKESAYMGTLATRDTIPVYININEMVSKHCAVLAMTGAGKSYSVGVLIEEIMDKDGSVVVFDPHGEYKNMSFEDSDVRVFSTEGEDRIRIDVASFSATDFMNLIPDITETQRDLLEEVINLAEKFYEKYDLNTILTILGILYDIKKGGKKDNDEGEYIFPPELLKIMSKKVGITTIGALMRRINRLNRMNLFDMEGTSLKEIVKRNQLTVIDLSDADERISEAIVSAISRNIFSSRKAYMKGHDGIDIPTFIIIEEAHNFAPRGMDERVIISRSILKRIAREGRKFGVGLCIVSQRPNKLDADILSQCNTQIILRIVNPSDQEYIRQSVETVTEDIVRDLPSLGRGEAIITGSAINLPVPLKIRQRTTQTGGDDINIIEEWGRNKE
ncbi:MAG: hypothetical protein DRO92_03805 [Candidatus Altiarchaeales archaeon]|nr:MAG: hypothetical protein DRO92_03805 [Candidatus Altiarchaeales archaeon]